VDINDVYNDIPQGEGAWHTFSALIKPDSVTVRVDLFRDGINNATGQAGIDAEDTWPLQMNTLAGAAGYFNSLRLGPPSGISGNDQMAFDNIYLKTITAPEASGGGSLVAVPEPASLALAAFGLACLVSGCRRRH
jgi:hypothetical protein